MKKILLIAILVMTSIASFGQAKKPTIMVVPSDKWCFDNGYFSEFDNMGSKVKVPDYTKAFQMNDQIKVMISSMADFMAQNEFPIVSLEQELARINRESAEMAMMTGKNEGGEIVETPIEALRRTAKADIILQLYFKETKMGPKKTVEFILDAYDAYTSKIISGNSGVSSTVSSTHPNTTLLQECVLSFKDNFLQGLLRHFDDLHKNGREITVTLFRYDSCPIDFEEEYEINDFYVEFADIIDAWFADNCVEGRYTMDSKSANRLRFTQVRIPTYAVNPINGRQTAIDAAGFVRGLVNMMKKEPYNLVVGSTPKGLGEVWITIGDK
jgi:hypothetical protein